MSTNETLASGRNDYMMATDASVNRYGELAQPPQRTGIDGEQTAAVAATALEINTKDWGTESTIKEPALPMGSDETSSVWNASYAGSYIEMHSGESQEDEFVSIVHQSGSRVTIDRAGVITIKSTTRVFLGSTSDIDVAAEGHITNVAQGGYTIEVTGGGINVSAVGDINFTSNSAINFSAGTDITMNAGSNIDIAAKGRLGMMAALDSVDIASGKKLALSSIGGDVSITAPTGNIFNESASNITNKAGAGITVSAGGVLGLKSGGNAYLKSAEIHLNDGDVTEPDSAPAAYPAQIGKEPPTPGVASKTKRTEFSGAVTNGGDPDSGSVQ